MLKVRRFCDALTILRVPCSWQGYDCFDALVGLNDGSAGSGGESKEPEGDQESKTAEAARSVTFEVSVRRACVR